MRSINKSNFSSVVNSIKFYSNRRHLLNLKRLFVTNNYQLKSKVFSSVLFLIVCWCVLSFFNSSNSDDRTFKVWPFEDHLYILPERIKLEEGNSSFYFTPRANESIVGCYTEGSIKAEPGSKWPCICRKGYYGPNCAIPDVVMTSACQLIDNCKRITARSQPRRIIHFFNFHHELDHIEVQLSELADVVDVFVIGESNRTTSGEPNELILLPKMKNEGFLKEYHHKIIYVMIPSTDFPEDPAKGGWVSDAFIRNYIGQKGLSRIDGVDDDDLVVLTDIDEFINRDVLLFLKLHDGYPEPVRVNFRVSAYTYYWKRIFKNPSTGVEDHFDFKKDKVACTVAMLRQVYDNELMPMRRDWNDPKTAVETRAKTKKKMIEYSRDGKHNVSDTFIIGRLETAYAAYHCTWCYRPEGIRAKWIGRNKAELPDWGPNKEKLDLKYLTEGLKKGNIFDGGVNEGLYEVSPAFEGDTNFAPSYVWKNKEKFAYLLFPEYIGS